MERRLAYEVASGLNGGAAAYYQIAGVSDLSRNIQIQAGQWKARLESAASFNSRVHA